MLVVPPGSLVLASLLLLPSVELLLSLELLASLLLVASVVLLPSLVLALPSDLLVAFVVLSDVPSPVVDVLLSPCVLSPGAIVVPEVSSAEVMLVAALVEPSALGLDVVLVGIAPSSVAELPLPITSSSPHAIARHSPAVHRARRSIEAA